LFRFFIFYNLINAYKWKQKREYNSYNFETNIENPELNWNCPKCNSENKNTTYVCNNCKYKLI